MVQPFVAIVVQTCCCHAFRYSIDSSSFERPKRRSWTSLLYCVFLSLYLFCSSHLQPFCSVPCFKMGLSQPLFHSFHLQWAVYRELLVCKRLLMNGFKPGFSCVGSHSSVDCATNTLPYFTFIFIFPRSFISTLINFNYVANILQKPFDRSCGFLLIRRVSFCDSFKLMTCKVDRLIVCLF